MRIVDNDIVNYCVVIDSSDSEFEKIKRLAKDGEYDISCETRYSFIEACNSDYSKILVRF